jgi:hypothetical protein
VTTIAFSCLQLAHFQQLIHDFAAMPDAEKTQVWEYLAEQPAGIVETGMVTQNVLVSAGIAVVTGVIVSSVSACICALGDASDGTPRRQSYLFAADPSGWARGIGATASRRVAAARSASGCRSPPSRSPRACRWATRSPLLSAWCRTWPGAAHSRRSCCCTRRSI